MSPMSDLSCLNVPSHMSPMPKMSQWSCLPGLHGLTCLVSPVFNAPSPCLNCLISHVWSTLSPIFPQRLWSMNTLEQSDACRYLTFPTILFNVVHKMNGQQKGIILFISVLITYLNSIQSTTNTHISQHWNRTVLMHRQMYLNYLQRSSHISDVAYDDLANKEIVSSSSLSTFFYRYQY